MKSAIIQIQGKQYHVLEGQILTIDRLATQPGKQIEPVKVLLFNEDEKTVVGRPYLDTVKVELINQDQLLAKKVMVRKFHRRKRYDRVRGHRQKLSRVKVVSITKIK